MVAQVILATERFVADGTDEGSLVGVCAHMDLKIVRLAELTLTEAADVLR